MRWDVNIPVRQIGRRKVAPHGVGEVNLSKFNCMYFEWRSVVIEEFSLAESV